MTRRQTIVGVPLYGSLGELADLLSRAIGVPPTMHNSYFRAGAYAEFALGRAAIYLQRNYDPDDEAAPYGAAGEPPFILDMWDIPDDAEPELLRRIDEVVGAHCPVFRRATIEHPFLELL